jgi:hypothetical protein
MLIVLGYNDHEYVERGIVRMLELIFQDKDVLNNVKIYTSSERRVIVRSLRRSLSAKPFPLPRCACWAAFDGGEIPC